MGQTMLVEEPAGGRASQGPYTSSWAAAGPSRTGPAFFPWAQQSSSSFCLTVATSLGLLRR